MSHNPEVRALRERLVEAAGRVSLSFGFGRNAGQVFMHVYLSPEPQSLDDLVAGLGISKGSASMVVRQLEGWGALRPVWRKGERRDFYEATEEFGRIVRRALADLVGNHLERAGRILEETRSELHGRKGAGAKAAPERAFMRERLGKIESFRARALYMWNSPVARMLLK